MSSASPVKPAQDTASTDVAEPQPGGQSGAATGLHPDIRKTVFYIVGAVAFLAITGLFEFANRPAPIKEFGKVGQEFYADFTDPTVATSLEVYVFDADNVKLQDFRVERLDNGRWVIPSHHNYPADAEDQLARTASSLIGIERGALVTRWEADHSRYGVVNPKQKSLNVGEVEGVGGRIILRGDDDTVLADYIIGNKVDGEFDEYYVRHPEEDDVYIAKLDIDLSTKFTDWIDTDLLDLDRDDVVALTLNDYSFDELKGRITGREVSTLKREKYSDPWKLDGLNDETEEVDKDKVREIVSAIADLKIAGVRPKQKGLTPELTLDRSVVKSQKDVDRIQTDLLTRGFVLQPVEGDAEGRLRLVAREGELSAATDDGLVYHLHFGRVFTGSQEELETGFATSSESDSVEVNGDDRQDGDDEEAVEDAASDESSEASSEDAGTADGDSGETKSDEDDSADEDSSADASDGDDSDGDDDSKSSSKPGRYAFVRVEFDEQYLGEAPVKPTEPEKPAELAAAEKADANDKDAESASGDASSEDDSTESSGDGDESADDDSDDPLAEIRKQYEDAKKKYDSDLAEFERKTKDRESKIEEGRKKAEELNRRFAEWYYVIPGDDFEDITLARADIVKEKEADEDSDNESASSDETDSANSDLDDAEGTADSQDEPAPDSANESDSERKASPDSTEATPSVSNASPADSGDAADTQPVTEEQASDSAPDAVTSESPEDSTSTSTSDQEE